MCHARVCVHNKPVISDVLTLMPTLSIRFLDVSVTGRGSGDALDAPRVGGDDSIMMPI